MRFWTNADPVARHMSDNMEIVEGVGRSLSGAQIRSLRVHRLGARTPLPIATPTGRPVALRSRGAPATQTDRESLSLLTSPASV